MRRSVLFFVAVTSIASSANAQVLYGSLLGNVKDSTEATVPDAKVIVKQTLTGLIRETVSNESGQFQFPTLPSGTYEFSVTRPGFTAFAAKNVNISANASTRLDVTLKVGAVTESISVEATAAALQTDRAEVRAELTSQQLGNAPLPPGRNYTQMFKTLPGFGSPRNGNGPSVDPSRAAIYAVNGTSNSSNAVRIEGAGVNQIWLPHLPGYTPALESIEAVNITTNSFDAETGLAGGAAVNVSIKSGTNALHGSAFEFHNSNATKAKPFFLPAGERKPKAIFNQMGGTIGGPIVRNKLFFFTSYEGTWDRQFASRIETLPTSAIRRGDMSASPTPIYDPSTGTAAGAGRTPFPNQQIPTARMDPVALKVQSMLINPSNPDLLTANLFAQGKYAFNSKKFDGKINWNPGAKLTMFARGGVQDHAFESGGVLGELIGVPFFSAASVAGPTYGTTGNAAVGATYVLSPSLIVDGNFGFTAYDANSVENGWAKTLDEICWEFLAPMALGFSRVAYPVSSFPVTRRWVRKAILRDHSSTVTRATTWLVMLHGLRVGTMSGSEPIAHSSKSTTRRLSLSGHFMGLLVDSRFLVDQPQFQADPPRISLIHGHRSC